MFTSTSNTSSPDPAEHLRRGSEAARVALQFQRISKIEEAEKKSLKRQKSAVYKLFSGPNAGWGSLFISCFIWATVCTYVFCFYFFLPPRRRKIQKGNVLSSVNFEFSKFFYILILIS